MFTATARLMNNRSYYQNILKIITIQTTKNSIKLYFKRCFDLCALSVDYHNARYRDNSCSYYRAKERLIL